MVNINRYNPQKQKILNNFRVQRGPETKKFIDIDLNVYTHLTISLEYISKSIFTYDIFPSTVYIQILFCIRFRCVA